MGRDTGRERARRRGQRFVRCAVQSSPGVDKPRRDPKSGWKEVTVRPTASEVRAMFEKRSDLARFLAVVETGGIGRAAERLDMIQPGLSRVLARLERDLGARLFERIATGMRPTALGAALAGPARHILREFAAAERAAEAIRDGRGAPRRVTAGPVWVDAVLPRAIARLREEFPGVELRLDTATGAEGLRLLAAGESDLHRGGVDTGERLPAFLRRHPFIELTAGIVAARGHPLLDGAVRLDALARCPWVDYDAAARIAPSDSRPSLARLLDDLHERTAERAGHIVRTASAGLLLMTTGPYLAWLALELLDRLPERLLRPVPVTFGRFRYRSGLVARRAAEDLAPLRRLEALVREVALEPHR